MKSLRSNAIVAERVRWLPLEIKGNLHKNRLRKTARPLLLLLPGMGASINSSRLGQTLGHARRRGFTLIELVVVVVIISVFAALAIPTVVNQLRDRRLRESAQKIASVYRQARLRAMGRGSAVLVRFVSGRFTVFEAQMGSRHADPNCAQLPFSSCLATTWGTTGQRRAVGGYAAAASGELSTITLAMSDGGGAPVTALDVCFTPMGRVFSRQSVQDADVFGAMAQPYLTTVSSPTLGRTRHVLLMPNGSARPSL